MLLSIIVPVYNVAQYLNQCITSLIHQSYQNLEILLIDDGSSDGSSAICDEWAKRDERIRIFHTENHGVSHARNIGLMQARGAYIGFVDADDWIDFDMYEIMIEKLIHSQAEICAGGFVHECGTHSIHPLKVESEQILRRDTALVRIFGSVQPKILRWELCDKVFSRKVLALQRFREDITHSEDMLFFWQTMKQVKKIVYMPLFKYHYRMRVGSAVNSGISEKTLTSMLAIEEIKATVLEEKKAVRRSVEEQYCYYMITHARSMMVLDSLRYKRHIIHAQQYIRKKIFFILCNQGFTYRRRFGAIFFCLPYWLCIFLSDLIKESDRGESLVNKKNC